jgi:23S rRNA (guanine2445-N2)-methyltransferase
MHGSRITAKGARVAESFAMIAKTFFGLEDVLAAELAQLGAAEIETGRRMCSFRGDTRLMYRANVCCRTAVRVLKPIARFPADSVDALYRCMGRTNWLKHLSPDGTLAIDPVVHGGVFTNSLYAAQVAKDAIVDQVRRRANRRPSVDLVDPDMRINLHADRNRVTVYLDSSGDSLHRRGYRTVAGDAPINEVLAAGILQLAGWDRATALADFMCGSGTFPIEAALFARRIAPGTIRREFGYMRWKDFSQATHDEVLADARRQELPAVPFPIQGSDRDPHLIALARENARRAGVERDVAWHADEMSAVAPPAAGGTLVANPPYDERIKMPDLVELYRHIGDVLKHRWAGYTAFILTGNREAAKFIGLRPAARIRLFNGPIECRLLKFPIYALGPAAGP